MRQQILVQEVTPISVAMKLITFAFLIISYLASSQVAINETSPSSAAALYLEAQKIPTTNFGGFLMPKVTEVQQALIPVSIIDNSDDGLMVFVSDPITGKQCWDIYDSVEQTWRSINCLNQVCNSTILYQEDFSTYVEDTGISGASNSNGNYPGGVTKWSLISHTSVRDGNTAYPGTLLNANDYAFVKSGMLEIRDANGPILFETQSIDISGYASVNFTCEFQETGVLEYYPAQHTDDFNCGIESLGSDYIDVLYSTNGGVTYTEVSNFSGLGTAHHTIADDFTGTVSFFINGISGSSLVIKIRIQNWSDTERYFLDNLQVICN